MSDVHNTERHTIATNASDDSNGGLRVQMGPNGTTGQMDRTARNHRLVGTRDEVLF